MAEVKTVPTLKPLHGGVIALVLLVGFYFLVYGPRNKEKASLASEVKQLEEELDNAKAVAELRPVLEKQIQEMGDKLAYYERRLPDEKEVPRLLVELRRAVEEEGVQLEALKAGDPENRGTYTTVPFDVEIVGGYHEMGKFVNRLESGERFLAVDDLSVESGRRDKDPRHRTAKLVVSTFWFNAPSEGRRGARR
jgi:type IV pilus assembly protein PilO